MNVQEILGRHYRTKKAICVKTANGLIESVMEIQDQTADLPFIAPGLVDIQINGCFGWDFSSDVLTVEQWEEVVNKLLLHGVTNFCATLVTSDPRFIGDILSSIAVARRSSRIVAETLIGVHLEGPYISPDDGPRGAHPREFVCCPNWEEFCQLQELAQGAIRIVTLAPERPHALEFIQKAVASGVVVGIGHTNATAKQIAAAVACGASLSTHLGNGCHAVLPRHANYIYEQLGNDSLTASLIADGHHLPANVLKSFIRAKGVKRSILISDAVSLTGMPDGEYTLWGQRVEVKGNKVVLAGTKYLAGAASLLPVGVFNAVNLAGCRLEDAIDMASVTPLRLLGGKRQGLQVGATANIIVFEMGDQGLDIEKVYRHGVWVDGSVQIGA